MVPNGVPNTLFEVRMFPVSFLMVSSQSSHFPSLMLTTVQRGAFGGLLPGRESVDNRPTKHVAWLVKPAKSACHKVFVSNDSDDADNIVRGKGRVETLQSAID